MSRTYLCGFCPNAYSLRNSSVSTLYKTHCQCCYTHTNRVFSNRVVRLRIYLTAKSLSQRYGLGCYPSPLLLFRSSKLHLSMAAFLDWLHFQCRVRLLDTRTTVSLASFKEALTSTCVFDIKIFSLASFRFLHSSEEVQV
jgi:hypothetical protein